MQYTRVIIVALTASIAAHVMALSEPLPAAAEAATWLDYSAIMVLVILGAFVAPRLRVPAAPLLVPLVLGILLQFSWPAGPNLLLPEWILNACFLVIGWMIGLRFTYEILRHALSLLPLVLVGVAVLMASCAAFAWVLVAWFGVDPLTALLALSPGGADSIAIIASAADVDLPFVMTMQSVRFIIVIISAPVIGHWLIRRSEGRKRQASE